RAGIRLRAVPHLGEGVPAVGRLVQAGLVRAGLGAAGTAGADHVRQTANGLGRPDEDVVGVARVDDDAVDPTAEERVLAGGRTVVRRVVDAGVGELRPLIAAIRRLVDADAGLTAGRAAVALAGPEVQRLALRVGGIEGENADGRLVEIADLHLLPVRRRGGGVVSAPDAAAGGAGPDGAVLAVALATAVGRHDERGDAARCVVRRAREGGHAGLGCVLRRPDLLPLPALALRVAVLRVRIGERVERRLGVCNLAGRHIGCRI